MWELTLDSLSTMSEQKQMETQTDSVMEILAAQCADLESLLALARRETVAAERNDFKAIMEIVGERATLGERLEIYHRQIAEMRLRLSESVETAFGSGAATRATELAVDIQTQDRQTHRLLTAAREEAASALSRLNQGRRSITGYLRDPRPIATACDQLF